MSLSEIFRISSSYLSKLFRQHAGQSLGEFLVAVRIDAAKRLIREAPDMPLKDVAERVGFSDPFYFSRVFKSVAGLPPSEYSRQGKEDAPLSAK
jgi:AraC-like DNA-binding protein